MVIPDNWTGSANSTPAYMNATAFSNTSSYQNTYNSDQVSPFANHSHPFPRETQKLLSHTVHSR
jgi:hypothetical protein